MSKENVEALMRELVAELVSDRTENIPVDVNFGHLGLDSMHAIHLVDELEKRLKIEVNPLLFWEYPTIAQLAGRLAKEVGA
jgi:acyl carrier protein